MNEIYMDPDAVTDIAKGFGAVADVLDGVSKAMEAAIDLLRLTAFIGLVGGLALERWLSVMKPQVDYLSRYCRDVSTDVNTAVKNYVQQDFTNAGRFG